MSIFLRSNTDHLLSSKSIWAGWVLTASGFGSLWLESVFVIDLEAGLKVTRLDFFLVLLYAPLEYGLEPVEFGLSW